MPFSQKKHPTALSPQLPVPAPGPWLCSSAPAFLSDPPEDWTLEPVPLCQASGTGLVSEPSVAGGGKRERGLAGAWEAGTSLPCPAPPKRAIPGTGKSRSQREDKVRPGRSAGKMSRATFCFASGFTEPKVGPLPLQANGYMTQTCPCSPTCIPLVLFIKGFSSRQCRQAFSYNPC